MIHLILKHSFFADKPINFVVAKIKQTEIMKRLNFSFRKQAFAWTLILIGACTFSYAAFEQLSKEQTTKQQLKSKSLSEYFALFYHYRNCVSYVLFSNTPEDIRRYAEHAQILELKMKELENMLLQTKLSASDRQSLELLISTQRMYITHANSEILKAQKEATTMLYCKEAKICLLLAAICLTILTQFSIRKRIRIRNRLILLKQQFATPNISYHKSLKLHGHTSKA